MRTNSGRNHIVEVRIGLPASRTGRLRGIAVRLHLDLEEGEQRAMTDILIGGSGSEPLYD